MNIKRDLMIEDSFIKFETLPFPLKEIGNNTIVKILMFNHQLQIEYDMDTQTEGYTFLLPPATRLMDLGKEIYEKY